MAVNDRQTSGVITLTAVSDSVEYDYPVQVQSIIFTGANAGTFTLTLDGTSIDIVTTTAVLSQQVVLNNRFRSFTVGALPSGGEIYIVTQRG